MALKATVFKASLGIADLDREYYAEHRLVLAREASETDERLMARLLAFTLNADPALAFSADMSDTEEPSLAIRDLEGRIRLWIEIGLPDPRRLRKAAGRASQVLLYLYHGRQARLWWEQNRGELAALRNLGVAEFEPAALRTLAALVDRSMEFQCTIQDGELSVAHGEGIVPVAVERLA
jgi:uncharacterized protein YaeQ